MSLYADEFESAHNMQKPKDVLNCINVWQWYISTTKRTARFLRKESACLVVGVRWSSGLERWTGDRMVLGSNPAAATSLRNFDNSVYPALPVSFGGDTKRRRSLLSGVYVRGSTKFHQYARENKWGNSMT